MTFDDNLRYWYQHELTRLRASERAGFGAVKEISEMERKLAALDKDAGE